MPLLDHFRPPVSSRHAWESFHGASANSIMTGLNRMLPRRYIAEFHIHLGQDVEAELAEFDQGFTADDDLGAESANGGVAIQTKPYAPPAVTMAFPAVFPDDIEVQVHDRMALDPP